MKNLIIFLVATVLGLTTFFGFKNVAENDIKLGAIPVFSTRQGGTGTSSTPTSGSLLVGNASGTYNVTTTINGGITVTSVTTTNLKVTTCVGCGGSGGVNTSTINYFAVYQTATTTTGTPNAIVDSNGVTFTNVTSTNLSISSTSTFAGATFSGNVGIGTTTPVSRLSIESGSNGVDNGLAISNSNNSYVWNEWVGTPGNYDGYLKFGRNPANQNAYSFYLDGTGAGSSGFFAAPLFNSSITGRGDSQILAWTNTGGSFNGTLTLGQNYPNGTSNIDAYIGPTSGKFIVKNYAGTGFFTVDSSAGNVGIGTTAPSSTLHIVPAAGQSPLSVSSSTLASLMFMDTMGNLGINTSSPQYRLSVSGTVQFWNIPALGVTDNLVCIDADGQLKQQAVSCTFSSARFKDNIRSMSIKELTEKVLKLRAVSFDFKESKKDGLNGGGKESTGFIAEEVAMIDPMLVVYTPTFTASDFEFVKKNYPKSILYKDGRTLLPQAVDYARVSVYLVGAYQNLEYRVTVLEGGERNIQDNPNKIAGFVGLTLLICMVCLGVYFLIRIKY